MIQLPLADRIRNCMAESLMVDAEVLTPNTHLYNDLSMDSIDLVEMVIDLEEEVLNDDEKITDETASEWCTVQNVIDAVEALAAEEK